MVGHLGFSETVLAADLVVRNGIFYKKFTEVNDSIFNNKVSQNITELLISTTSPAAI